MPWVLVLGLLGLLGCQRAALDPLAAERAELSEILAEQPAPGWAPHATVSLSSELLNRALAVDISGGINKQMEPSERNVLGMKVLIRPESEVESFVVTATDACESCLQVALSLAGKHDVDLTNTQRDAAAGMPKACFVRAVQLPVHCPCTPIPR